MNSDDIKVLIEASIEGAVANVSSDDNVHFEAIVISHSFIEKSLIQKLSFNNTVHTPETNVLGFGPGARSIDITSAL